jgi:tRNA(Arg) A34 adenosine deaminase TadA
MTYDPRFLRRAIALAREHMLADAGGPFGAVVVRDGRVLAEGWNEVTSLADPTAHAEVQAIRKACAALGTFELRGCELYASCEPCPMCLGSAYWARVESVYFAADRADAARGGFDDAFIYDDLARPVPERRVRLVQDLAAEGREPFEAWLAKSDRRRY